MNADLNESNESRAEVRKTLRSSVTVFLKNAPPIKGRTVDVSLGGVSLMMPAHIPPGQACGVAFDFPINEATHRVEAVAKVAYSICVGTAGFRIGCQFTNIDGASRVAISQFVA